MTRTLSPPPTSRGEQARQALLQAALILFGEKGAEGATTREIATRAGQNIAAITYYFGSKEGLYLAVAGWIADSISANFTPFREKCSAILAQETPDPACCLATIHLGLDSLLRVLTLPDSLSLSKIMSREQLAPTEAYQLIHQRVIAPLHGMMTRLTAIYTGLAADDPKTVLHTHAAIGNVIAFLVAREAIRIQAGWEHIGEAQIALISEVLHERNDILMENLRARYFPGASPSHGEHHE